MEDKSKQYVMITCVSQYRMRYAIPVDELQECNPDVPVDPITWGKDSVTCENVEEFSQEWLGEVIIDAVTMSEDEMVDLYDSEYDHPFTRQEKINRIRNWKRKDA